MHLDGEGCGDSRSRLSRRFASAGYFSHFQYEAWQRISEVEIVAFSNRDPARPKIRRVTAWLRRLNPLIKGEDCGLLVLKFANGVLGQWDANRFNEPDCPLPDARYTFGEFLVEGNGGSLRLYLDGRLTLKRLGGDEREIAYTHEHRGFAGDCCYTIQRHFVDRMLDGKPFETSGEDYLKTLAVQEALINPPSAANPWRLLHHPAKTELGWYPPLKRRRGRVLRPAIPRASTR